MKSEIHESELDECELNLAKYVVDFEKHYGQDRMRFNVHLLDHFTDSVRYNGPAWSNSTFPFEGNMRTIKRCVNGTRGIENQIARKTLQLQKFKSNFSFGCANHKVEGFCKKLFKSHIAHFKTNDVTLSNPLKSEDENSGCQTFKKCMYKKRAYTTDNYNRSKIFNDSYVQLKSQELCQVNYFMKKDHSCEALVTLMNVSDIVIGDTRVKHVWKIESPRQQVIVPIENVECKLVPVNVKLNVYLWKMPNSIEVT